MKQIFTLISILVFSLSLAAQSNEDSRRNGYNQSKVTISTLTDRQVKILVDGNNYSNRGNKEEIVISNLRPGYHAIKVYQQKNGNNGRRNNSSMQLVYDANVYVRAQYHIDIVVNRFGKAFVDERQMTGSYYDYNDYDNNDWGNNNNNNSNYNNGSYMQAMNSRSFDQFKQSLRNESFDNTRLVLARQTIASNYFSATQVKDILQLFSYENNKLDVAEYAYKNTVDKNNYFMLNDAFAYSGSKEELARYIREYK